MLYMYSLQGNQKFRFLFQGKILLFGEFESLKAIEQTSVVRVPKPLKVFTVGDRTTLLVTELLNFTSLDIFQGELGKQLAKYSFTIIFNT